VQRGPRRPSLPADRCAPADDRWQLAVFVGGGTNPCDNFYTHTGSRTLLTGTPAIMFEQAQLLVIYCCYQLDFWTYAREQDYGHDT
jgi:hypothetical protein